jgi:sugar lactone lactonase YvrE
MTTRLGFPGLLIRPFFALMILLTPHHAEAQYLYVSDGSNSVYKIDTSSNTIVATINGFTSSQGLAIDPSGTLYVADQINQIETVINKVSANGTVTPFFTNHASIIGLAFDGAGNLYEAAPNDTSIFKVTTNGDLTWFATDSNIYPFGLAVSTNGIMAVASPFQPENVATIPVSATNGVISILTTNFSSPLGVAYSTNGLLYVTDVQAGSVSTVTTNGIVTPLYTSLVVPAGLTYTTNGIFPGGTLYVADTAANSVYVLSTGGSVLSQIAVPNPYFLAVETIPEPSVWCLLAVGLIVLLALPSSRKLLNGLGIWSQCKG